MTKSDGLIATLLILLIVALTVSVPGPDEPRVGETSLADARRLLSTSMPVSRAPEPAASSRPVDPVEPSTDLDDPVTRRDLVREVMRVAGAAVPRDTGRLMARYDEFVALAQTITANDLDLGRSLERAFVDRFQAVKRAYYLSKTTASLEDLIASYRIPGPQEEGRIRTDLGRLSQLQRDVRWVEDRFSHQYPRVQVEHLDQLVEILKTHSRL